MNTFFGIQSIDRRALIPVTVNMVIVPPLQENQTELIPAWETSDAK
jgi:hypothetical protein